MRTSVGRCGFTLVEMMVSIAVLAVSVSVVTMAVPTGRDDADPSWNNRLEMARRSAAEEGVGVVVVASDSVPNSSFVLPDGRVVEGPSNDAAGATEMGR